MSKEIKIGELQDSIACKQFVDRFQNLVIGQPGACQIARMVFRSISNPLRDKHRPLGVFALLGPSRTGKTMTAKALSELLHGRQDAFTKINCADFGEKHQLLELKGAPPSYVGYKDSNDVRKLKPDEIDDYSRISPHNLARVRQGSRRHVDIVLLDEFEKGHRDMFKMFMGIFDDALFTFGNGGVADYSNTVFILTMNLGMDKFELGKNAIGYATAHSGARKADLESIVCKEMERAFKPEFRNRIDKVVIFHPHDHSSLIKIVKSEIRQLQARIFSSLPFKDVFWLVIDDRACSRLLELCGENHTDAAGLKGLIEQLITPALGEIINSQQLGYGDRVTISLSTDEEIVFKIEEGVADEEIFNLLPTQIGRPTRILDRAEGPVDRLDFRSLR